ncbi:hypothetical protein VSQ78_04595 [Nocardiopsis alba]|uniref:Uncharacterized protein n=1 Tax=Nocardiopsis alba TaxID=53437 RepID=A0ABV5DQW5_9ACTN
MTAPEEEKEATGRLLEIWGDTVDSRHTLWAILLGAGIAVPLYLVSERLFAHFGDNPDVASTYALLVGLGGCLLAGFLNAVFFRPKRIVRETAADGEGRRKAMDAIEAEIGPLGDPSELPAAVQEELRTLGLYDDLLAQHRRRSTEAEERS